MEISIRNRQRAKKLDPGSIRRDLERSLRMLGCSDAEVSVVFVGERAMSRLNRDYRGIAAPTDVLSFPLDGDWPRIGPSLLGDIVVCVPRAVSQAKESGRKFPAEVRLLLVHGLLHLLGYDHETCPADARRMKAREQEILRALAAMA